MKINGLLSDYFTLDSNFVGLPTLHISVCCCNQVITWFNDNDKGLKVTDWRPIIGNQNRELCWWTIKIGNFVDEKDFLTHIFWWQTYFDTIREVFLLKNNLSKNLALSVITRFWRSLIHILVSNIMKNQITYDMNLSSARLRKETWWIINPAENPIVST